MNLKFPGIPPALRQQLVTEAAAEGPFKNAEEVEVVPHADGLVFKQGGDKGGFAFCKRPRGDENDVEVFRAYIQNPTYRRYMPVTYEIGEDPTLPEKVVEQFREKFSAKAVAKIDWLTHRDDGKLLLILSLPEEIVFAMFHGNGGQILTTFHGKAGALRKVQMLAPLIPETAAEDDVIRRVYGTQYGPGGYQKALAFHWQTVQELAAKPNLGISFGPVGIWTP